MYPLTLISLISFQEPSNLSSNPLAQLLPPNTDVTNELFWRVLVLHPYLFIT